MILQKYAVLYNTKTGEYLSAVYNRDTKELDYFMHPDWREAHRYVRFKARIIREMKLDEGADRSLWYPLEEKDITITLD